MTLVLTYGTFDLLHVGHVNLLRRARALGDRLVVGLSSDAFNALKRKQSTQSYADREAVLRAIRYVDDVFPEESWEQKAEDIRRLGAGLLVMGSDWTGHFDHLACHCPVRYLPRTENISSSALKAEIRRTGTVRDPAAEPAAMRMAAAVLALGSRG
ncbi:glycerol-3-phosphate cytidylyltransferase [Pseudoxanthomonas sp. SGNA-20]|uniref:Glycerol-3-phosphate cytidylyltransferase n=1 Tax=Pseudoxanthomonas taiwanensis J19 TaxID=935569 RepID=A0A562DIX3_9GAMM|nr:adenylyltransferase/cytidyltransferase family protein [Pseudoxanthomonas taiwanensis]RRN55410.1 glycerol-3-phosphate cytidylyltransferase [Pseudoxanthomonas sp. SGNA-20]TWH09619.1 glycerol-3-phosphate cytidylyltransferase [Pseudoxanthomonas taiwanensis J19]